MDSEAQRDQVLSQSPVWLKIKVKEAIAGKRHLSSELPPPLPPQLTKYKRSVHFNVEVREGQNMATLGKDDSKLKGTTRTPPNSKLL